MNARVGDAKTERRELSFASVDEILAEAERLAAAPDVELLGNWSLGQILDHLALAMEKAIDGSDGKAPLLMRLMLKFVGPSMLRSLEKGSMPSGFKMPKSLRGDFAPPAEVSTEDGLEHLRRAVDRWQTESKRAPHVAFGNITPDQHDLVQRRHAEMHLSHVIPK